MATYLNYKTCFFDSFGPVVQSLMLISSFTPRPN